MATVSTEELKSTIAHELGHLSNEHTLFSKFIYKVYNILYELDFVLACSEGYLDRLFYIGLHKYIKKFDILSYSVIRKHELQADEFAAKATSPEVTATMLCRIALVSSWLHDNYWKKIWRNCWQNPVPNDGIIINACKEIAACKESDMKRYYNQAKMYRTKTGDTHPSLSDRVKHLGCSIRIPKELKSENSSLNLLEKQKDILMEKCDKYWQDEYLYEWQQEHSYMSNAVMRRDLVLKTKNIRTLLYGEEVELAQLIETTLGLKSGYKQYLEIYKKGNENKFILLELCRILFSIDEKKAEKIAITLAKNTNPTLTLKAYDLLIDYYEKIGNIILVEEYRSKHTKLTKLIKQRTKSTNYELHSLSASEINDLKLWLKSLGNIDFALVYQVSSMQFPDFPLHRLVISSECYIEMCYAQQIWSGMKYKYDFEIIDADDPEFRTKKIVRSIPESIIFGSKSAYT